MKFVSITALLILISATLSYGQQEKSVCTTLEKDKAASDEIILTVCNYAGGMAPLPRTRLYFRLYKSGLFEYEVNAKSNPVTGTIGHRLIIKKTRIPSKDAAEIIRLGQTENFQNAASVYPIFRRWTDSQLETTLIFRHARQEKKIVVNNFSIHDEENKNHYPASLLEMLRKIWSWRSSD